MLIIMTMVDEKLVKRLRELDQRSLDVIILCSVEPHTMHHIRSKLGVSDSTVRRIVNALLDKRLLTPYKLPFAKRPPYVAYKSGIDFAELVHDTLQKIEPYL